MTRRELVGVLGAGGGMTVLGCSFAVSSLLVGYPVLGSQALRYALATLVLALLVRRQGVAPAAGAREDAAPGAAWQPGHLRLGVTCRELGWLVAVSLTGLVGFNLALLAALAESEPAAVGVIVGCSPLLLALLGPALSGGRPRRRAVAAAIVVSAGAAIAQGGGMATPLGVVYALLTLLCEAAFSLLAVPVLPRLGPLRVSAYVCAIASVTLGAAAVLLDGASALPLPTFRQAAAIGYLALPLTVGAFIAWYSAVERLGVERAGLFVGLVPVTSLAAGVLLGTGTLSLSGLLGASLVGAGVALSIGGGTPAPGHAEPLSSPVPDAPAGRVQDGSPLASTTAQGPVPS